MERKILRGDRDVLEGIRAGDMVELRYFPHSAVIVALNKLDRPEPPAEEATEAELPAEELPRTPVKPRGRAERPEF